MFYYNFTILLYLHISISIFLQLNSIILYYLADDSFTFLNLYNMQFISFVLKLMKCDKNLSHI